MKKASTPKVSRTAAPTRLDASASSRPGGTSRAIAELEAATHRLTLRRLRDMLPGRIATRRLVLRAPMRGDVPELVRLADNPVIAERLIRLPSPYTRADAIGFVEIFAQRPDERPYAITLDDRLVGIIGLSFHEGRPPELGYWLGEPYWGRGYMTEAGRGLVDAAHQTGHFERLGARALVGNTASRNVLGKLGFVETGTIEDDAADGTTRVLVQHELERPRWM